MRILTTLLVVATTWWPADGRAGDAPEQGRVCATGAAFEFADPCRALDEPKGAGGTGTNLSVEAGVDKTTGSLSATRTWVSWGKEASRTTVLNLTAKAPFDSDKDDIRDIGSLSELTTGSSVGLDLKVFFWPMTQMPGHLEREAVCIDYVRSAVPGYLWQGPDDLPRPDDAEKQARILNAPELGLNCYDLLASDDALEAAVAERNKLRAKQREEALKEKRSVPDVPEAVIARDVAPGLRKKALPRLYRTQAEHASVAHGVRFATTANRKHFDYVDPLAPAVKESETRNGVGISIAYEAVMARSVARLGAGRERSYKGAEKQALCNPLGETGSFTCMDVALAPPKKVDETVYFAEYRSYIPGSTMIAIAPRLEFNTGKNDYGFQLPVYLVADPKRVLDGGVVFGWTSEDDFSFGIFFGKSFKFFD